QRGLPGVLRPRRRDPHDAGDLRAAHADRRRAQGDRARVTRIVDISPPITEALAVWPGDAPFRRKVALSIAQGANIDLSAVDTTVHLGAHADAPSHYVAGGDDIARRPLELYYGPCQVVRVEVGRGERVRPAHLRDEVTAP